MYCEVYLFDAPYHIDRPFDYYTEGEVSLGCIVKVPFGRQNHLRLGVVTRLKEATDGDNIKPVHSVYDDRYSLSEEMLGLCLFLKAFTLCTFGEAAKTVLPPGATSEMPNVKYRKTCVLNLSKEAAVTLLAASGRSGLRSEGQRIIVKFLLDIGSSDIELLRSQIGVSYQNIKALEEKGIKPNCVAGFSLGEIAALAFSGILTDGEAFKLVCKRGELMDKAATENPGAMAAVMKITPEQVEEICKGFDKTYPVNYNSPAQTVVATTSENAEAFCEAVKAAGGRAKLLAVSGAFHSPFMAQAADGLAEYMKDIDFKKPQLEIYSDVTALPYEGDYKALVKAQVESPVRWQSIVENMIDNGVDTFIEVGVGKTLTGLIKRINGDVKAFKVETPEDIEALEL
jgi:[acyl-carrier-protein] S-malonyltransferase